MTVVQIDGCGAMMGSDETVYGKIVRSISGLVQWKRFSSSEAFFMLSNGTAINLCISLSSTTSPHKYKTQSPHGSTGITHGHRWKAARGGKSASL